MGQAAFEWEHNEVAILVVDLSFFDLRLLLVAYSPGVSYIYKHNMDVFTHLTSMLAPIQIIHCLVPPFFGTLEVFVINNNCKINLTWLENLLAIFTYCHKIVQYGIALIC